MLKYYSTSWCTACLEDASLVAWGEAIQRRHEAHHNIWHGTPAGLAMASLMHRLAWTRCTGVTRHGHTHQLLHGFHELDLDRADPSQHGPLLTQDSNMLPQAADLLRGMHASVPRVGTRAKNACACAPPHDRWELKT